MQVTDNVEAAQVEFTLTPGPKRVLSSASHGWEGTLALDISVRPECECRHEHQQVALQSWRQPLSVRALDGSDGWRTVGPGARVWLPGEAQYFQLKRASRTHLIFISVARIEQILEKPYSQANLERWRGLDFASAAVSAIVAAMAVDVADDCPAGPLVGDSLAVALVAHLDAGPNHTPGADSRGRLQAKSFERALEYVEANLSEPLRVGDLARQAGCSPKQLSRAFR